MDVSVVAVGEVGDNGGDGDGGAVPALKWGGVPRGARESENGGGQTTRMPSRCPLLGRADERKSVPPA